MTEVNDTAHAAWAKENIFDFELKKCFVPAQIFDTFLGSPFSWAASVAPCQLSQVQAPTVASVAAITGKKRLLEGD